MTSTAFFNVVDLKTGRIVHKRMSAHEAHRAVDLLNACGIVRYKARAI